MIRLEMHPSQFVHHLIVELLKQQYPTNNPHAQIGFVKQITQSHMINKKYHFAQQKIIFIFLYQKHHDQSLMLHCSVVSLRSRKLPTS